MNLKSHIRIIFFCGLLLALFLFGSLFDFQQIAQLALNWIRGLGAYAPLIYLLLYIVAITFCLPTIILNLGAGLIFGLGFGSLYACSGILSGSIIAFCLMRLLMRQFIMNKFVNNSKIKAIDEAVYKDGLKIVFFLRISPIFPLCLTNYALALSKVSFKNYCFGSIGAFFWTINYVYLGSLMSDLSDLKNHKSEFWLRAIGLLVSVLATIYLTNKARKALNRPLAE